MVNLLNNIIRIIVNPLIIFLISVAVLFLLWNVFKFIREGDNADSRSDNAKGIMWGIVGLAIMISAYGIINFILGTIGL